MLELAARGRAMRGAPRAGGSRLVRRPRIRELGLAGRAGAGRGRGSVPFRVTCEQKEGLPQLLFELADSKRGKEKGKEKRAANKNALPTGVLKKGSDGGGDGEEPELPDYLKGLPKNVKLLKMTVQNKKGKLLAESQPRWWEEKEPEPPKPPPPSTAPKKAQQDERVDSQFKEDMEDMLVDEAIADSEEAEDELIEQNLRYNVKQTSERIFTRQGPKV
jgi:hypothetical protein